MDRRSDYKLLDTRFFDPAATDPNRWLARQLELERIERDRAISVAKELAARAVAPLEPLKETASTVAVRRDLGKHIYHTDGTLFAIETLTTYSDGSQEGGLEVIQEKSCS